MSEYKGIKGFQVQTRSTDPVPFAQEVANNPYAGVWGSGGDLNTGGQGRSSAGTQPSNIVFGGAASPFTAVEEYNGSSWTETTEINTGKIYAFGFGANAESALMSGGYTSPSGPFFTNTETWNGSSWTEVNEMNAARGDGGSFGVVPGGIAAGGYSTPPTTTHDDVESWNGTSWSDSAAELNQARYYGGGVGYTSTAGLIIGGKEPSLSDKVESWNGSSWTEIAEINTARERVGGSGSSTAGLVYGGGPSASALTEDWNGTAWTEVNDMATARYGLASSPSGTSAVALASGGYSTTALANTEEWTFSGLQPTDPSAGYVDAITGDFYYNSSTGQFKTVNTGGAPIGTWSSGDNLNEARYVGAGNGIKTAALGIAGGGAPGITTNTEQYNGSAWTEIANVNTGRANAGGAGTTTAGLFYGGGTPTANASNESWNGTAWTEVADLNAAVRYLGGSGTSTAALQVSGSSGADVEQWDGSSWTEVADVNNPKSYNANVGTVSSSLWFGGIPAVTEEWNGSAWTELSGVLNQARGAVAGTGSAPSALCFGGWNAPSAGSYAQTEAWNGTAWTEVSDLSSARALTGSANSITTNTSALSFGGTTDGGGTQIATTDEWSADDFQIKTVTTS